MFSLHCCQFYCAICLLMFTANVMSESVQAMSSRKLVFTPSLVSVQHPEEDILFKWRLRRKIEQAGECAQPLKHSSLHGSTFTTQAHCFSHPSGRGQAYKVRPLWKQGQIWRYFLIYGMYTVIYISSFSHPLSVATPGYSTSWIVKKSYTFTRSCYRRHRGPSIISPSFRSACRPCFCCLWIPCLSPTCHPSGTCPYAFTVWHLALSHPIIHWWQTTKYFPQHRRVS